ncbi:large subunit GTPase 1 [Strigomonas culicis]|uniref:Large subunit GTPase 1 n=1 Tax=Strigomonas culicis TaxID=28005 RepID=S9U5X1_9TRYP|nr:large subunit GTPase 1 [Strigomonas culicis]|eukprot:EPY26172.1 large subunit GTPase 1 [Strigomonas culicis]
MKTAEGVSKKIVLLLNKADLLTETQRQQWSEYFVANGDLFFFFSAKPLEPEPLDAEDEEGEEGAAPPPPPAAEPRKSRHKKKTLRAPVEVSNAYELAEQRKALKNRVGEPKPKPARPHTQAEMERDQRVTESAATLVPWSVLDPIQLLDQFALLRHAMGITGDDAPIMVGFVGFPNVGKSSTINAIMGAKKVLVSATPGKTKHFQTLVIPNERRVALCDCPGLVFPSFASTKEQMVTDGILPIDNATDVLAACGVVGRRIPRPLLEAQLNISLLAEDDMDESETLAERLLNTLARRRGYMASHDRPNRARAGKELLKAYMDGRFIYVEPPPSFQPGPEALAIAEAAAPPAEAGEDDDDDEEYEDWDSEDERAWADLEQAADDRALSEGGSVDSFMDVEHDPPIFYIRARGRRHHFTRRELFNAPLNLEKMAERKVERRRRRKHNQQLEPDLYTFVNRQGEVELRLDDDDGVVELVHAATGPLRPTLPQAKHKSKRQERRELKKLGAGPTNPSAKRVGIQDYKV